jgi:hypothetical protein
MINLKAIGPVVEFLLWSGRQPSWRRGASRDWPAAEGKGETRTVFPHIPPLLLRLRPLLTVTLRPR